MIVTANRLDHWSLGWVIAYAIPADIGFGLCQRMNPSRQHFRPAQSLYVALFVERTPVVTVSPILEDFESLEDSESFTLLELRPLLQWI